MLPHFGLAIVEQLLPRDSTSRNELRKWSCSCPEIPDCRVHIKRSRVVNSSNLVGQETLRSMLIPCVVSRDGRVSCRRCLVCSIRESMSSVQGATGEGQIRSVAGLLRDYRGRTTNVENMNKLNSWLHLYYSIAPCFDDPSSSKICRV